MLSRNEAPHVCGLQTAGKGPHPDPESGLQIWEQKLPDRTVQWEKQTPESSLSSFLLQKKI